MVGGSLTTKGAVRVYIKAHGRYYEYAAKNRLLVTQAAAHSGYARKNRRADPADARAQGIYSEMVSWLDALSYATGRCFWQWRMDYD